MVQDIHPVFLLRAILFGKGARDTAQRTFACALAGLIATILCATSIASAAMTMPMSGPATPAAIAEPQTLKPYPGMPPLRDPSNVYGQAGVNMMSANVANALHRVYVPNLRSNSVSVIDPDNFRVIDHFATSANPQHIIPSWDLKTLWIAGSADHKKKGSLMPVDPATGKPGLLIPVRDAYNLYFTPDGKFAIVVAEGVRQLEFRDAHTMKLDSVLTAPGCAGINHADYAANGEYAIFTCEFTGSLVKIDVAHRAVLGYLSLSPKGMPQDIRISPDGKTFFVADMMADGVFTIDGASGAEPDPMVLSAERSTFASISGLARRRLRSTGGATV